MNLRKYISKNYPIVKPFEGINSIEKALLEHQYLVIADENCTFYGILIASDIIKRPHKIVIDCFTKKESLLVDDTIASALKKFKMSNSFVLPVMDGSDFIGVIEKDRILKELETKNNQLYSKTLISEKAKNNFLNNLSHEIRTPLNAILGFIEIISQLNKDDSTINHEKCCQIIGESADHFLEIMKDLIELSLLQSGDEVSINKDNVDIIKILNELKNHFNKLLCPQNKKATIIYLNSESSLNLYTDGEKLKHILYHLINNAIKFSDNKKVTFGFELVATKNIISFFVKNDDYNIAKKDILKMFNIFEKQEDIENELNPGLGIGLPLVKSLTNLLGGHIKVETKNNEICFIVSLPIK